MLKKCDVCHVFHENYFMKFYENYQTRTDFLSIVKYYENMYGVYGIFKMDPQTPLDPKPSFVMVFYSILPKWGSV